MGMVLALTAANDESIAAVLADPPLIWKLLAPDDPEVYERSRAKTRESWFSRLFGSSRAAANTREIEVEPVEEIDLDKSWNGIHYLLTGTSLEGDPPLNFLIDGGEEVGNIEVGYGPARALRSAEVVRINSALTLIDDTILTKRFDPNEMSRLDIYPDIWLDDTDNALEYCVEYFNDLKQFLKRASEAGNGVVISIQ